MEPVVHGRPSSLDVHYPMVPDQNSRICLINITPPKPAFLPWLKRVFHHHLGIMAVRFAGTTVGNASMVFQRESEQVAALRASPMEVGDRTVWILPHNTGDNAFRFAYHHIVSLSLEKMPLELWN